MMEKTTDSLYTSSAIPAISEDERIRYLDSLQESTTNKLIPTVIFLVILDVVGIVGNSMVLLVYFKKNRRNATDIFIITIASFDLITNVAGIPNEVYDLFHFWDFDNIELCKFRGFINTFTSLTSAMVLLAVATARYRMICRPFGNQISLRIAKLLSVVFAFVCFLCAVPQLILYGLQTKTTARPDIVGQECSVADKYVNTIWPLIFTGFLTVLFLSSYIPLIILYVLIGVQAWRHSRIHGNSIITKTPTFSDGTFSETVDSEDNSYYKQFTNSRKHFTVFSKKGKHTITSPDDAIRFENKQEVRITSQKNNYMEEDGTNDDGFEEKSQSNRTNNKDINYMRIINSSTKGNENNIDSSMLSELKHRLNSFNKTVKTEDKGEVFQGREITVFHETQSPMECLEMEVSENAFENNQDEKSQRKRSSASSETWTDITNCLDEDETLTKGYQNRSSSGKMNFQVKDAPKPKSLRRKLMESYTRKKSQDTVDNFALFEINESEIFSDSANCPDKTFAEYNPRTSKVTIVEPHEVRSSYESNPKDLSNTRSKSLLDGSSRKRKSRNRKVLTRTTLMLIIISAVFVVAFLPYLILSSLKFASPSFYSTMSPVGESIYNIFLRFYFINSAANAIIYSLCDIRFRTQAVNIFRCKK